MPSQPAAQERSAHRGLAGTGAWAAALAVVAVVAQLPLFDRNFVPMDEGHLALSASRLLGGDVLYRDIHTGIFPGIYALTAGLFALFGEQVLVTRYAEMAVNVASALLLWWIGLRLLPPRWAWMPPVLFVALVWISFPVLSMFNYSALAGMLGLAALLFALRFLEQGRVEDAGAVGLLVGACLFTKQNYGGLAAVGLAAGLVLARRHSALGKVPLVRCFAPIVVAGTAFLVVTIGWLAASGTLGAWVDSTLTSLVGSQLKDFDNPIPPILGAHPQGDPRFVYLYIPSGLFDFLLRGDRFLGLPLDASLVSTLIRCFYGLPLAALVAAPAWLVWSAPTSGDVPGEAPPDPRRAAATLVVVFAVVFFFGIFPSAVFSHLVYVLAPILLLFAWLGAEVERALAARAAGWAPGWRVLCGVLVGALVLACASVPVHVAETYTTPSGLPHVNLLVTPEQAQLNAQTLRFIDACAAPGEPIFTLPILPVLYLASSHPNPVKWDLLIPGAIDQRAIVAALERNRVRCVVRQRDMNPEFPPLRELYPVLDGYVTRHYRKGVTLEAGGQVWHGLTRTAPFAAAPPAARGGKSSR